jgi:hypothetical protein
MKSSTICLVLCLVFASAQAWAQSANTTTEEAKPEPIPQELAGKLRQGGFLIFFRHGLTPNYKDAIDRDPDDPRPGDCSYQRNLSADGIEQARAIGEAFRELEIPVGIVRASPMCRAMDTAWYAFGRYERDRNILLHGTNPDVDPPEAKIWKNVRNIAKIPPLPMTNSIFMSHGTIGEVFGAGYLDEGEAVIVEPDGKGSWRLIARVKSDQWMAK